MQSENEKMLNRIIIAKSTLGGWKEREKTLRKYSQLISRTVTVRGKEDDKTCGSNKRKSRPKRKRRNKSYKEEQMHKSSYENLFED